MLIFAGSWNEGSFYNTKEVNQPTEPNQEEALFCSNCILQKKKTLADGEVSEEAEWYKLREVKSKGTGIRLMESFFECVKICFPINMCFPVPQGFERALKQYSFD